MRVKKYFIAIFIFALFITFSGVSKASYLEFDNLNYEAIVKENGDIQVTEQWKINIEDTNTMFKTWNLDTSKFSGIENVVVSEVLQDGSRKEFNKIDEEMYHVTKGCYYALPISKNKFEVAWGVQVSRAKKYYEITYTVKDAVKRYADCYEMYWQFIGSDNGISAKSVTGTITLENAVKNKENLRAWAHGPLNGNVEIKSASTIGFNVNMLNANTYVEVRMAILEEGVFSNIPVSATTKNFASILSEETAWADKANYIREQNTKRVEKLIYIYLGISIILILFAIIKLVKSIRVRRENAENAIKPIQEYEYFRDMPDELSSPAEALFIYNYPTNTVEETANNGKILSATILNLCLKNRLEFEVDQTKKKNNIVFIVKDSNTNNTKKLTDDEELIFELLVKAADYKKDNEEKTTGIRKLRIKELEEYAKAYPEKFVKTFEKVNKEVKNIAKQKGKYDEKISKSANKWSAYFVLYLVFGVFALPFLVLPGLLMIITSVIYYKTYRMMNTLTQKGEDEKAQWKGLKKYMEEFSLLKDKEVPHLVLWEKYLVYATAFGIADKVIKQLKIVYPHIANLDDYAYMGLVYNTAFTTSFIHSLNNSVTNVYNNASASYYNSTSSSGGGFGGGFSSGGGFGGGGRWNAAEDKMIT